MVPSASTEPGEVITTSFPIDRELWAQFETVAKENGRSRAAELRQLIKRAIADTSAAA